MLPYMSKLMTHMTKEGYTNNAKYVTYPIKYDNICHHIDILVTVKSHDIDS